MLAIKLLVGFSPWIVFWIISSAHTMISVQIGIGVAAALVVAMGVMGLHRGMILWAGVVFFGFALIFVIGLHNLWVIQHLGVIASVTLFTAALISMSVRQPFTLAYARQSVPQEFWQDHAFVRGGYITTAIWTLVFLANTLLNVVKLGYPQINHWYFSGLELGILLLGVILTTIFAELAKRQRLARQADMDLGGHR